VCVRGQNGAFAPGQPFELDVYEALGSCPGLTAPPPLPAAAAGKLNTIIITDVARMNPGNDPVLAQQIATMQQKLLAFASRPEVAGVVVDMGSIPEVVSANATADENVPCTFAKNIVGQAIKNVILSYEAQNPLEYVVLVGNDSVIPYFRHPDLAGLANEMDYYPPVLDSTSSQAALRLGEVLSQDDYGAICGLSINGSTFPIADLAVGRLVEQPAEISGTLDAYPAATGGVVATPTSAFVSGYDFMLRAAVAIDNEFSLGTGFPTAPGTVNDQLLAEDANGNELSPQDARAWTAVELRNELLDTRHDMIFLGGHFDEGEALAADWTTIMDSSELAASTANLVNAIVLGCGCHVGFNTVASDAIPNVTLLPDWARTFAQKQVGAFIGGTGYQYGDTDFIAYNDLLYLDLAQQLLAGSGPVSVGKALMAAKRQYLANTPVPLGIDAKAVLQTTLFGLPMLSVNLPYGRGSATAPPSIVTPPLTSFPAAPTSPGAVLGLQYADVAINTSPLYENTVTMAVYPVPAVPPLTVEATYLSARDGQVTRPGEPVLPLIVTNATVPNTVLRGVVFRSGVYADTQGVLPLTGAPATEIRGVSVSFQSQVFYPIQTWSVNYFDGLCNPAGGNTRLMLFPAQYQTSAPGSEVGTRRSFSDMAFRLYYSANTQTYTGANGVPSTPCLANPPSISGVASTIAGNQVTFQTHVVGNPAAGIQEVWATYTAISGAWYGQWQSISLAQQVADSTLWTGSVTLPNDGTSAQDVRFFVQAVNGVGLATMDTQHGAFYTPGAPALQPTTLTFGSFAAQGNYGAPATFSALLSESATATAIGNQPVIFGLGSQELVGTTAAANGQATVDPQLLSTPGTYLLQATFPGTDTLAPASATALYTVDPQATQIVLAQTGPQNNLNVTATLTDVLGQPLVEKTLFFVVSGSAGSQVLYVVSKRTDYAGSATLGSIPLAPGAYTVIAYFGGTIPLSGSVASPATSTQVTDENYLPTSARLPINPQAQASTVAYLGETVASSGGTLHLAAKVSLPASAQPGSNLALALVQWNFFDANGNPVPDTEIVAPVDADGTSLASIEGLAAESYTVQIQAVGSAFASPIVYQTVTVPAQVVCNGPLVMNGGTIQGSVQQLEGNPVTLNSQATISGDLLVPGTPSVVINGKATIQGTIVGAGSSKPSGYPVTLNSGSSLRYLRTRINPATLPSVPAPPAPKGTRSVTLNSAGQSPGVFSTILNLTLNGNVGQIAVPPGTYGTFTANGTSGFTLGTAGSTEPEVYDFQNLILNSGTHVSVVGPVIVVLASSFTVNGGMVGLSGQPTWLQLMIAGGGMTLNGGATLAGLVTAPGGTVVLNGSSVLMGALQCNQLIINSNCLLQGSGE